MRSRISIVLLLALAALTLLALAGQAWGQLGPGGSMPRRFPHPTPTAIPKSPLGPGKIRLSTPEGDRGPVTLSPKNGGFVGDFVVSNDGPGPLTVTRVAMRTDDDDPRLPMRFQARFSDGGGGSTIIHPHSAKHVTITWVPDREPKLHEALGHVVVTSSDEEAGEVAMGFLAPLQGSLGPIQRHLLTWILVLPMLFVLAALAMHLVGYAAPERLRGIFAAMATLECVLAAVLYEGFTGTVSRADGNDGFQFLERSVVWQGGGVEYFVGVDGVSVALVLLLVLVGFVGAFASYAVPPAKMRRGVAVYYALLSLLYIGAMGVLVSLDLAMLTASWTVMLGAVVGLVATSALPGERELVRRVALHAGGSVALLAFAVWALRMQSDPTFLADGTRTSHSLAIPELMRVAYNAKHLELFGFHWVKVTWGALFVAFGLVMPLFPLHSWLKGALRVLPVPASLLLGGGVLGTGVYGLVRVSTGILPDGSRWAATTVAAFGVLNLAFGVVTLLRAKEMDDALLAMMVGHVGFSLVGFGGLSREGIAGCLLGLVSQGLLVTLLIATTSQRPPSVPLLRGLRGLAVFGLAGTPGLGGFWAELMPVMGVLPTERVIGCLTAAGATMLGYALLRLFFTSREEEGEDSSSLTPEGARTLVALVPVALLALALGAFPGPFLALVQGGVSDVNLLVNPPGPDEIALAD